MTGIVHVRSTMGLYGAERVILNLLPELLNRGHEVELVTLEGESAQSGLLAEAATDMGLAVRRFRGASRADVNVIRALRSHFRQRANVVHSHDYKSLFHACFAALGLGQRLVHHQHGALGNTWAEHVYAGIERLMLPFANTVCVVSDAQRLGLEAKFWSPPVAFVRNGTVAPETVPAKEAGPVFRLVHVARFTEEKNHELALEVVKTLRSRDIPVHLTMIGAGPLLEAMQTRARELNVEDAVAFPGYQASPGESMMRADVMLLTSHTEGLPMAVLESLACATPVVSTPVGQVPQLLAEADCGVVVPPEPDAFGSALVALWHDPVRRAEMGMRGRKMVVDHYSVASQAEQLLRLYHGQPSAAE